MGGFSNGSYSRYFSWTTDANNSIDIRSDRMDTEDNGFATGLSTCLLKDGTQTVTANIPFAAFRLLNIGNSVLRSDAIPAGQVQDGATMFASSVTGTNIITFNTTPTFTAYAAGQVFRLIAAASNTGAVTVNGNSVGAIALKKRDPSGLIALSGNEIIIGIEFDIFYDGTQFELLNPVFASSAYLPSSTFLQTANSLSELTGLASTARTNIGAASSAITVTGAGLATGGGALTANEVITVTAAAKADMQTPTSSVLAVTPAQTQNHPGVAKASANCTVSGTTVTLQEGYNAASVTRLSTGQYRLAFTTNFVNGNYQVYAFGSLNTAGNQYTYGSLIRTTKTVALCDIQFLNATNSADDPAEFNIICFGKQ